MKSLQDYITTYRNIAANLNMQGDSVEILVQMLANASYISEVENIAYAQESSLERSTLINSKIQLCVDNMYSVFRGNCPRVILNIKPLKPLSFTVYDKLISGNGFTIYYLGYYPQNTGEQENNNLNTSSSVQSIKEDVVYADITLNAVPEESDTSYKIVGLLCSSTVEKEWELDASNTYYIDCLENNLSNDMWAQVYYGDGQEQGWKYHDVTREFSDHIINGDIFDLTLPSFGSRLYVADIFREIAGNNETGKQVSSTPIGTRIKACYYVYSSLDDYNKSAIKQIKPRGAQLVSFSPEEKTTDNFLAKYGYEELAPGIVLVDSVGRDELNTIHYKASRERYVNSILRSNSDLGVVLEEMYPDLIYPGGTTAIFDNDRNLTIYYIPSLGSKGLSGTQINDFINSRSAYYISSDNITVETGYRYGINFSIDVEIYQIGDSETKDSINEILNTYMNKFNINLKEKESEIRSLISKISNVKQILGFEYSIEGNPELTISDLKKSYFVIAEGGANITAIKLS